MKTFGRDRPKPGFFNRSGKMDDKDFVRIMVSLHGELELLPQGEVSIRYALESALTVLKEEFRQRKGAESVTVDSGGVRWRTISCGPRCWCGC